MPQKKAECWIFFKRKKSFHNLHLKIVRRVHQIAWRKKFIFVDFAETSEIFSEKCCEDDPVGEHHVDNQEKHSYAFPKNKTLFVFACLLELFVLAASFLLRRRLFVISTRPNISDRIWSRLTKIGGWEEKCQQYLISAVKTQTRVGFTKEGVPVSFHQSKGILG